MAYRYPQAEPQQPIYGIKMPSLTAFLPNRSGWAFCCICAFSNGLFDKLQIDWVGILLIAFLGYRHPVVFQNNLCFPKIAGLAAEAIAAVLKNIDIRPLSRDMRIFAW